MPTQEPALPSSPRPLPLSGSVPAPLVRRRLGRGRSGIVYAEPGAEGYELACKVFVPDTASTLVMTVLTGAANPYRWCRAAVESAVSRRRILSKLVDYWFQGQLRLPRTEGWIWNEAFRAYELRAERVDGRHALLRHPGQSPKESGETEARELVRTVLRPLQAHLSESGFDGLLWQAGLGNPVAAANFMREQKPGATAHWVWIDLESGVPALFPFNPWRLFSHYLPLTDKHGRWLFDDVDIKTLRGYCDERRAELLAHLGPRAWNRLCREVDDLAGHQRTWKSLGRTQRSVSAYLAAGRIDQDQARHYWRRPVAWLGRLTLLSAARLPGVAFRVARRIAPHLRPRALATSVGRWSRFFGSQRVRARWANQHVRRRVVHWRERGFLSRDTAAAVRGSLRDSDAAEYMADFGVCLALKPLFKGVQWGLIPLLYAFGAIESGWLAALLLLAGGAIGRTLYTAGRCVQAVTRRRAAPWVALLTGALPVAGNAAYPLQLLWSASGEEGLVARFLVHDLFTTIGRHVPIWGGSDTLCEHRANDLAGLLMRLRGGA